MTVKLIQLLCTNRHCLVAVAYESDSPDDDDTTLIAFQQKMHAAFEAKSLNPWCGICKSQDLSFEIGTTRFASLEEAKPFLAEEEAKQTIARIRFGGK